MVGFDGPLTASAYDLLGVASDASDEELRRAYRLRLRQTHPDTGGDAAMFVQVQRAWEQVGDPHARDTYDRGQLRAVWAAPSTSARTGTRPQSRAYGQAGAWRRRRYLAMLAEHLGRTVTVREAYDSAVVRSAPWDARRMLAGALAEESAAAAIADLGIGFTAWHDIICDEEATRKLDHVVLGPHGLYGLVSEDFGETVRFRQGEVVSRAAGGRTPVAELVSGIRWVARTARVRFTGAILVLPDDDLEVPTIPLGAVRGLAVTAVRRSMLRTALRGGVPGARPLGATEAFDVRTRLTQAVHVLTP